MMKKVILALFIFATGFIQITYGQCTTSYQNTGVYPKSLPDAYERVTYMQEVDFTIPADTTIGGQTYHFDSAVISNITGFPGTQFSYTCSQANCQYVAGTGATKVQGCLTINGVAPLSSAGSYKLHLFITLYVTIPFVGQQNATYEDSSVNFIVKACTLTSTVNAASATKFCPGQSVKLSGPAGFAYHWLKNGASDAKDTLVDYTASDSGWYSLVITSLTTGCMDTSATTHVTLNPMPAMPNVVYTIFPSTVASSVVGVAYEWKKNGSVISATGQTISLTDATFNGSYAVRVKNAEGCWSDWSEAKQATYSNGVGDINSSLSFHMSPNPAHDQVNIQLENRMAGRYIIRMIDITGKTVNQEEVYIPSGAMTKNINTGKLSAGIYQVQVSGVNSVTTKTLVIE